MLLLLLFCGGFLGASAQKLDSLYFNLYTDSLKKGTHNYINVEGRYSNGRYLPLSEKDIQFTSSDGKFEGNSLYLEPSFSKEKVTVKAVSRQNPRLQQEMDIYIKQASENERLPTVEEVLKSQPGSPPSPKSKRGKK